MRTVTVAVYEFMELSPEAKEIVRARHAAHGYYHSMEAIASLEALASKFHHKLVSRGFDFGNEARNVAYPKFTQGHVLSGREVKKILNSLGDYDKETYRGHGSCVLTGYCSDEDAIDGFRIAYMRGERDLQKLLHAAWYTWHNACHADYMHQLSDEGIAEDCEANDEYFLEDGKRYTGERPEPIRRTSGGTDQVIT